MEITRQVVLDAERADVWEALVDPEIRAEWLEDDRPLDILSVRPGEELTWRWCAPDGDEASTVVIRLDQVDDDQTILTVTEHRAAAPNCSIADATIDVDAWDRRLLGLELRCVLTARADALVSV